MEQQHLTAYLLTQCTGTPQVVALASFCFWRIRRCTLTHVDTMLGETKGLQNKVLLQTSHHVCVCVLLLTWKEKDSDTRKLYKQGCLTNESPRVCVRTRLCTYLCMLVYDDEVMLNVLTCQLTY